MRFYNLFLCFMLLAFMSCEKEAVVLTNEFGATCTIIEEGTEVIGDSIVLGVYGSSKVFHGDSLVQKRDHEGPIIYQPYLASQSEQNPVFSFLKGRKVGDSLLFEIPRNEKTKNMMRPDSPDNAVIKFTMRIKEALTFEEYQKRLDEEAAKMIETQDVDIQKYLNDNGMADKAKKLTSGMYVVVKEEKGGQKPKVGEVVQVHYTGNVLNVAAPFDSSIGKGKPFEFGLGQQQVIRGWDLGIAELGVGDKATLLIPSNLGYGPRGAGQRIPPNAILKFEVELVGIGASDAK